MTEQLRHQGRVDSYFSSRSDNYTRESEKGLWSFWKKMEFTAVLKAIEPLAGCRVLEVGCGAGWYAGQLIRYQPSQYVAIDRIFSMVKSARCKNVAAIQADLKQLPLKAQFDRILCAGALEFISDPRQFFSEVTRLLNPNGKLVLLLPPDTVLGKVYRWWHKRHGFRIHLFRQQALSNLVSAAGLKINQIQRPMPFTLVASIGKK